MTKETLAALLNGREYGSEMTKSERDAAKALGLVIVFGYSDDNTEFYGAMSDEVSCYGGKDIKINSGGPVDIEEEEREVLKKFNVLDQVLGKSHTITAIWDKEGYAWTYKTDIPHASFDIMEDGSKYCRGIVFSIKDL